MIRRMVMKRFISLLIVLVIMSALLIGTGVSAASLSGDANGDGEIDNKDVVILFRFLSGSTKNVVEDNCDYNNDGEINNKDVVILFRWASNPIEFTSTFDKLSYGSKTIADEDVAAFVRFVPEHFKGRKIVIDYCESSLHITCSEGVRRWS